MNGRYLLDTNIVIAYLTGDESIRRPAAADRLYVSSTVVGELFYGAMNSQRVDENTIRLLEFVSDTTSIPCDNDTAKVYGELKTSPESLVVRFPTMTFGLPLSRSNTR